MLTSVQHVIGDLRCIDNDTRAHQMGVSDLLRTVL